MFRLLFLLGLFFMAKYGVSEHFYTAEEQAQSLWEKIESSAYDVLPPMKKLDMKSTLKLMCPHFNNQAFLNSGTVLAKEHPKILHRYGTNVRITFEANPRSIFSGILKHGTSFGLARLSLGLAPSGGVIIPGIAIKLFIDNHEPLDILAMPSIDGQNEANLFKHLYRTRIDPPRWNNWGARLLSLSFSRGLREAEYFNCSTTALSNYHLARTNNDGSKVEKVLVPLVIILQPTPEAQSLLEELTDGGKFREILEGKGYDIPLFQMYGIIGTEGQEYFIGTIKTTSHFIASSFSDNELFFKHPEPLPKL